MTDLRRRRFEPDHGYTITPASELTGVTCHQLDYWARTRLVEPSINTSRGSGDPRRYSRADLITLAAIHALLDAGLSLQSVRPAIAQLRGGGHGTPDASLVLAEGATWIARDTLEVDAFLRTCRGVVTVLPLAAVAHRVDNAIAAHHERAHRAP